MVDSLINPLFQYKMPLLDGAVASTGLSKPKTMSDYLNKQAPQYSEAYFPFDPREKEGAQFAPWSNSKTCLLDGRSSTSHLSGMEGKQHMLFRQNSNSSKEGTPQLSPLLAAPVKQGFTLYSKSPGVGSSSAATSVAVGKPRSGGEDSSPQPGSPVYLAVPKPVYGRGPCCGELCCVRGRYCPESGFPRLPHPLYKHNWVQSDAPYGEGSAAQKKAQDSPLQHGALQFDGGAERLKRVDAYSPGRERPLPSIVAPNYSGYPCAFYGSFGKQGQQTSPGAYPNLFPSHHTYEHMTSEVYQEHSPMTKYGHVTQRPVFYYSQADVEVENRSQCKNGGSKPREDSPVAVKHALPPPQEHFVVPSSLHAEAPLPHFQHHALLQGFGYPCYGGPRFNVGVRQSAQPPPAVHIGGVHFPPANLCPDYHVPSSARLHDVGRSANPSFLRVDRGDPPRYSAHGTPVGPAPALAVNRLFHPPGSLSRAGPQAPGLSVARFLPYSPSGGQVRCPDLAGIHPIALGPQLHPPLHHYPDQIGKSERDEPSVRANAPPSSVKTESRPNDTAPSLSLKSCLKRSIAQPSPPMDIKEERDLEEHKPLKRWKKMEEAAWLRSATASPPMPVIDNVFSLAPYQAHARPPAAPLPGAALRSAAQPESGGARTPPSPGERGRDQAVEEICAGGPARTPPGEILKPQDIKVERDASDDDGEKDAGRQDGPVAAALARRPEDLEPPSTGCLVVIKKCEPEELEVKPLAVKSETSDESGGGGGCGGGGGSAVEAKASPQSNAEPNPGDLNQPQPAERSIRFKNINPRCLKLSTYNIVLPNAKTFSPAPAPKKPSAPPAANGVQSLDAPPPVHKHFYELHHSLYKLISKSVFATSEQELRALLSQLDLSEISYPSSKIKNMSSLLGVKPRELWFNKEVKSVFHELLGRLSEYTAQERCPFPHIMRTSAVFLPMLVLKELLFPMVQSSFIDQVLQEHRVELRPTTLSEEKILLQLHKRACSSRLRKLMSLKHLPNIYADMVNILYYTCISKHLESTSPDAKKKAKVYGLEVESPATGVKDEVFEVTIGGDAASPPPSPAELCSPAPLKEQKGRSFLVHSKAKSRIKRSSRRLFLDESLSDEGEAAETNGGRGGAGRDAAEASWMCPLNFEDVSAGALTHPGRPPAPVAAKPAAGPKSCSGVILKLRRMFSTSLSRKKARYQAVSDSRAPPDRPPPPPPRPEDGEADGRAPKATARWQRAPGFRRALGPVGGSPKRPLLKIKYCPYLSACYGADRRRRWVLRSAVQRARGVHYPDLVGKRIRHLYEEDDKSEVWYRGEVLRVHEAHANPLKTIFEVRYDSEPEWRYYLELLIDYKKGWLKVDD